ncbi:3-dehydroquinate synthase [Flavobacterium oreochromis]|uniref:3-dehydroquinate synthase n=2 Tax=Flavobacterium TaxID=237 RepID=A0A246G994_9FLAO|nr:3-dehydroquinate synthase [Flavobacterium oreochromis]OWP76009.1 3-dehydroquinate synthase [Flavobacterium oreochromis]OWP77770.1 3-dehydroquinate synthase [Flavobacterium oreochromis]POR21653.1 3-dehydroquinate synthase [Flavobacterium columnare]
MQAFSSVHFVNDNYLGLNQFLKENQFSKIFILVDENTNEYCLPHFLPYLETELPLEIIELEAGEENKTIETCVNVWEALTELGADRKSLIINVGGGVITDMGGFIASTFKRGLSFINIPTTLLAMVDASIGGKNGVDLGGLKNQIGTITQPEMVLINTQFLQSLSQRELRSGLAEMLKHGLIGNKNHWNRFKDLTNINFQEFDFLIEESIAVKAKIVKEDPREIGIRKALNFGHTLGHAIETYFLEHPNKERLLHGEAIACGIILESFLSVKKDLLSLDEYLEIKNLILNLYDSINFNDNEINFIMNLLIHDKKNEFGKIQFTLLNSIGQCIINQTVTDFDILAAFDDYKN